MANEEIRSDAGEGQSKEIIGLSRPYLAGLANVGGGSNMLPPSSNIPVGGSQVAPLGVGDVKSNYSVLPVNASKIAYETGVADIVTINPGDPILYSGPLPQILHQPRPGTVSVIRQFKGVFAGMIDSSEQSAYFPFANINYIVNGKSAPCAYIDGVLTTATYDNVQLMLNDAILPGMIFPLHMTRAVDVFIIMRDTDVLSATVNSVGNINAPVPGDDLIMFYTAFIGGDSLLSRGLPAEWEIAS